MTVPIARIKRSGVILVSLGLLGLSLFALGGLQHKPADLVEPAATPASTGAAASSPPAAVPSPGANSYPDLSPVPVCTPNQSASPIELDLETGKPLQFPPCVYAPGNEPFEIVFADRVTGTDDGNGLEENVSIYRSRGEAVTQVASHSYMVGPANREQALFVGDSVMGPATIIYHVPALPSGEYYIQSDKDPTVLFATLVVA
jgi:hypothetical protein